MAQDKQQQQQSNYNTEVTQTGSNGLHTDNDPINQPKGTYRFALNAVNEGQDGQHGFVSNEKANYNPTVRPVGFEIIGDCYLSNDTSVVLLVNPTTNREQIATIDKDNIYRIIVDTGVLDFNIRNQAQVVFRLVKGKERIIYWVDALNNARTFNLDRIYNFYNTGYQSYLRAGGNPNTFSGEKWDASSFDLIKSYASVPFFTDVDVIETGSMLPGSYNFAIQYVDEDLNPTEWITTSNTVNIYNDSTNNIYANIRGSRNAHTDAQNFPRASKSINLTITNLDTNFPYYRIGIMRAAGMNGLVEKVLVSDLNSTSNSNFTYAGNDDALIETALGDILVGGAVILAPEHIEQLENRLLLLNTRDKNIDWCTFQTFASRIKSDVCYKDILLNTIESDPNVKNPKSTFMYRGYMPGEVYSFGIVYLFKDNSTSPVFHIPGKSSTNTSSHMKVYNITNKYLNIHNCSVNNYWDKDMDGLTLVGKNTRHHRFPFRKDVTKPLFTTASSSTDVDKYRLSMVITLNPSWIPNAPPDDTPYPEDVDGNPIVITWKVKYQIVGNPTDVVISGTITDTDMGGTVFIYDDTSPLDEINPPDYGQIDTSQFSTYQDGINDRFVVTFTYTPYTASSINNVDSSQIFGIEFGNIARPHPDVVGFYIVRNERTQSDRMILDNAVFGSMVQFQNYKSFGLINPKQFYTADNCGAVNDSGKTLVYYDHGAWFFNPEYQFFNKIDDFTSIVVEGKYSEASVNMPTISDVDGSPCNAGGGKGIYIQDVQAGTSYNSSVDKTKDNDGFDLLVGYRNINMTYAIENSFVFPVKSKAIYLTAANYQNIGADTFYNVSVDNKIGMYLTTTALDPTVFFDNALHNHLIYGSLVRDSSVLYSDFMTRTYYKEHNNPVLFGDNEVLDDFQVFNGDAQISAATIVSSVLYDIVAAVRSKKKSIWKIIVGAVLIVAAIVVNVVPALGQAASVALGALAVTTLSLAAVSLGVSLISSGIKLDQLKSMVEVDYELGLKNTITDGGVYECIRENMETEDDTIRWFADRVTKIYIESSVPFGLRAGCTFGITDFINSPTAWDEGAFISYMTEKLTILDQEQNAGRLYKGYATAEFYDMNLDYLRFNKEKSFIHLPTQYDCCADKNQLQPLRVWYSEQSFQEELVDNYRVFLPNNYRDIEGEHGEITGVYKLGSSLFIQSKEALWHLPQNLQERVTSELVSFIGTGAFFSVPPRKVIDDTLGSGGTQHKWATVKTRNGVVSVNEVEGKVYLHAQNMSDISMKGMRNWFENNLRSFLVQQIYEKFQQVYPYDNNPANPDGVGYLSTYDTRYERVIITKRDYQLLPSKLAIIQFTNTKPSGGSDFVYTFDTGEFFLGTQKIHLNNTDYFENKSWTISYSFHTNSWVSWHNYIPNYYVHNQNNLYSTNVGDNNIWKHNQEGKYQTFYNVYYPFIIEYVNNSNPLQTMSFESFSLQTKARKWDTATRQYVDQRFVTFNKLIVYNNFQSSGELLMITKDIQDNPQNWLQQQITNQPGDILITRKERDWHINDLRDYVIDYTQPLFSNSWNAIKAQFFIDKVANNSVISYSKSWAELQNFRDKYVIIRLKFDTFNDVNLIMNFSLEVEQTSNR